MAFDELKAEIEKDLPEVSHIFMSSVAQQGLVELKDLLWAAINE